MTFPKKTNVEGNRQLKYGVNDRLIDGRVRGCLEVKVIERIPFERKGGVEQFSHGV